MNIKTETGLYYKINNVYFKAVGWDRFVIADPKEITGIETVITDDEMKAELEKKHGEYERLRQKAEAVSKKAHAGQVDKSGVDYFTGHISTVAGMVEKCSVPDPYSVIVALLHDVIEDTDISAEELREDFPDFIVDAVLALTKTEEETYARYVLRAKKNPLSKTVKMCDLANNMDLSRLNAVTEKDEKRILKYAAAYNELMK